MLRSVFCLIVVLILFFIISGNKYLQASTLVTIKNTVFQVQAQPAQIPYVKLDEEWQITETIQNGNFTDGLSNWLTTGNVEHIHSSLANPEETSIRLGLGGLVTENSVSQDIVFPSLPPSHLTFQYRLLTQEVLPGFDKPCFQVRINDQVVLEKKCTGLTVSQHIDNQTYLSSDWQTVMLDLRPWLEPELRVSFWAGNTVDDQGRSGADIKDISTNTSVLKPSSDLSFTSGQDVAYSWNTATRLWENSTYFRLEVSDARVLTYWLTTDPETTYSVPLYVDAQPPPSVDELGYYQHFDQSYSLTWMSPGAELSYEVRQADHWQAFFNTGWHTLPLVKLPPGLTQSAVIFLSRSLWEREVVHLPSAFKGSWLAIKTKDPAGNYSGISQIVELP